jgi:CRP/FNR family cyclic AMP-dependent transcriptional regulator
MSSFFDYPDQAESKPSDDLVLLPRWSEDKWALLAKHAELISFQTGDDVIRVGESDRSFFIIIEGVLEILIPRGRGGQLKRTQTTEAGAVIGEQAFIDSKPRSATIRALTAGKLLRLSVESFDVLAAHHPDLARDILFDLARILSIKLRHANLFISNWIK